MQYNADEIIASILILVKVVGKTRKAELNTQPIAKILSVKNARAWVSMVFT